MGWYDRRILPYLIRKAMRQKPMAKIRQKLMPLAAGKVLEIGFGPGLNLPYYGGGLESLVAIDPSEELRQLAEEHLGSFDKPFEFIKGLAESLPFENKEYDTVVCTWTLCSTVNPVLVLSEIRRVLKPAGTLIFAEHSLAPDRSVQRWQNALNPIWKRIAGGCNLNRPILRLLGDNGFVLKDIESNYLPGPRPATYTHRGIVRIA